MLLTSYHSTQQQLRSLRRARWGLRATTPVLTAAAGLNLTHGHTINYVAAGLCIVATVFGLMMQWRLSQHIILVCQHQRVIKRLTSNGGR